MSNIILYNATYYITIIIFITYIIIVGYIKLKHPFWSRQPVFHTYNLLHWIYSPEVIIPYFDEVNNKYYDPYIKMFYYNKLSEYNKDNIVKFLKKYYINNKYSKYNPDHDNIFPYFESHNDKIYFHINFESDIKFDFKKKQTYKLKNIVSMITNRPLNYIFDKNDNSNKKLSKYLYYVDFLCCDVSKRGKNNAAKIIYTHAVDILKEKPNQISLMKREGPQFFFVPLTIYKAYCYDCKKWNKPLALHSSIKIVEINKTNYFLYNSYIDKVKNKFNCFIYADDSNILRLLETKNIYIYAVIYNSDIVCVYFFRNSCMYYNENKDIELFASINNFEDENIFIIAFYHIINNLIKMYTISFVTVECISHNYKIIEHIESNFTNMFQIDMGYYLYNSVKHSYKSNDCLILN